jgi:antitoxin (DNA-binding transcriptional repressor) of toxin-antitoxin stability system
MTISPKTEKKKATVSLADAKARFSEMVKRAEAGEEITITRHGLPVVELKAAPSDPERPSILGMFEGKIWIADDFDELGPEWDEYLS